MSHPAERHDQQGVSGLPTGLEALRQSPEFRGPVEALDGHHCNDHFAQIYESGEERFSAAIPFMRHGLERGDRCLYVVDESTEAEVKAAMRTAGLDVDAAVDSGALSFHTVQDTYLRNETFNPDEMVDFYAETVAEATVEYEALRIVAETTWLQEDATTVEQFMDYEAKVNELFAETDALAICQYDRNGFPPEVIREIVQTHPHLIYDGAVCHNVYYTPPAEFFGPDQPTREVDRMLRTLRDRTAAKATLEDRQQYLRRQNQIIASPDQSFEEKLQALFELGCDRFDMELGAMARVDTDEDRFEVEYVSDDHAHFEPGVDLPLSETYCTAAADIKAVGSVADPHEEGYDDIHVYQEYGIQAYLGTYLTVDGGADRTFFFVTSEPRAEDFSADERAFIRSMGQWVKHELERRQRERFLRESYQITSDPDRSFEEKLEALLDLGCEWFGLETAALSQLPSWNGKFRLEKGRGLGVDTEDKPFWTDPGEGCFCRRAIAEDTSVSRIDVRGTDWAHGPIYEEFGLTCYLGTRVMSGSTPYGTLWFGSTEPREREFSDTEHMFIELMGQWVSYEIERREHQQAQRELYKITADSELSFEEKVDQLLDLGRDRFGLEMGFFLEKQGDEFGVVKTRGTDLEDGVATLSANPGHYCKQTITVDVPVGVEDTAAAGWDDDPLYREYNLGCYLGTRVTDGTDVFGSVCFADSSARNHEFTDAEYTFLDLIGQWLSYELERQQRERELRERTEHLSALVETTPECIKTVAADGTLLQMNPAGLDMVEADSASDVTGECVYDLIAPEHRERFREFNERICRGERGTLEFDIVGLDGTRRHMETHAAPLGRPDGTTEQVAVTRDITNQVERKQQLEETVNQLQQSNDRLKQFAYAASHDLQEPLRMVSSYLQLLENRYAEDLDADAQEYIDFAVDGADRMRAMVDDLLAFARVEQADRDFDQVDCDAVLDRVMDNLKVQIDETDAEVTVDSLPTVRGDREQLEQLFSNLVSNAIKYNESDPPCVEIITEQRTDRWELRVSDNGIGIDPEKTDRIFEVFKRLHHDDDYPGTGIGLSLCQEIVDNHGGDIQVESTPGEGSTFCVTLPQQPAN